MNAHVTMSVSSIRTNVSHHECECEREPARDRERDRKRESQRANNVVVWSMNPRSQTLHSNENGN